MDDFSVDFWILAEEAASVDEMISPFVRVDDRMPELHPRKDYKSRGPARKKTSSLCTISSEQPVDLEGETECGEQPM